MNIKIPRTNMELIIYRSYFKHIYRIDRSNNYYFRYIGLNLPFRFVVAIQWL